MQDDKNELWITSRSDGVIIFTKDNLEKNIFTETLSEIFKGKGTMGLTIT